MSRNPDKKFRAINRDIERHTARHADAVGAVLRDHIIRAWTIIDATPLDDAQKLQAFEEQRIKMQSLAVEFMRAEEARFNWARAFNKVNHG